MGISKYEDLTDLHMDVLKEVGNIGSGNAATSLSAMVGREIMIEMPSVKLLSFQDAIDHLGGAEQIVAGILVRLKNEIDGMILLLLERRFSNIIISTFFNKEEESLLDIDQDEVSALSEVGNIMASSYVSAIGTLSGLNITVEAPKLQVDMLGALMSVPAIEFGNISDNLLFIDKSLKIGDESIKSNLMLIPTVQSLKKLLNKLGVEA